MYQQGDAELRPHSSSGAAFRQDAGNVARTLTDDGRLRRGNGSGRLRNTAGRRAPAALHGIPAAPLRQTAGVIPGRLPLRRKRLSSGLPSAHTAAENSCPAREKAHPKTASATSVPRKSDGAEAEVCVRGGDHIRGRRDGEAAQHILPERNSCRSSQ